VAKTGRGADFSMKRRKLLLQARIVVYLLHIAILQQKSGFSPIFMRLAMMYFSLPI